MRIDFNEVTNMETYKKPVVASKNDPSSSMVMRPLPFPLKNFSAMMTFIPKIHGH